MGHSTGKSGFDGPDIIRQALPDCKSVLLLVPFSSPEPIKVWVSNAHAKISIGTQALVRLFILIIVAACLNFRMMAFDVNQCLAIL